MIFYAPIRGLREVRDRAPLAGIALLAIVGGAAAAFWQAAQARQARIAAEREARIATATAAFITRTFSLADPAAEGSSPEPTARQGSSQT